jgi:hypothetical protein
MKVVFCLNFESGANMLTKVLTCSISESDVQASRLQLASAEPFLVTLLYQL